MAQVKTKKDKVEFNEAMINWTGYKRKVIDVNTHLGPPNIQGGKPLNELLTEISTSFSSSYERQITLLTSKYGELSNVKVHWNSGYGMIYAKALESEENFKKRVFIEERQKFNQGKMEEDRKVKQKEKDLKMYEKIKVKYNLV